MGRESVKIQTREEGGCQVVTIHGSADIGASGVLRKALLGAIESGATRIVCDLSGADFICSDALGILIVAYLKAQSRGGFVRLAGPRGHLLEILETTRLNHLFDVFPDVASAAASEQAAGA